MLDLMKVSPVSLCQISPPYARLLRKAWGHSLPTVEYDDIMTPANLDLLSSPEQFPITFLHPFTVKVTDITHEYDTLGFILRKIPSYINVSSWIFNNLDLLPQNTPDGILISLVLSFLPLMTTLFTINLI